MDVFGGAPRFLAYPRAVGVQTGTDAVLKCQISGDPRPAVIWERNNEKVHPGGRYRVFEDGNIYNLIITGVTTEDSGQYICKAKNCIGETYAAATLKVEGEAQEMELREENKPRFLIKPLSTRVGRGEDAVFSCKLWGNPRPEVVWEKDGRKLNEIFESTHFSVGYQDGGWYQLKIFKTRAPDGGVYTCKARNEFGESLAGAVLLVDAGPGHEDEGNRNGYTNGHWKSNQGKQRRQVATRLKEDPQPNSAKVKMFAVTEGKHAKFRCFVTGKPKPEIIWRKDGRLIMSGRRYLLYEDREGYFTLKVLYCKQQDNGVYVCAASNTAGQTLSAVHLSVKEPPVRFKQPLNDLQVWERDLAVLECEVPEDSIPITWYLEDRRLQPGAKYGMEEWGTKRRLTIRDIGVDDDGIYLCEMADGGRSIAEVAVKGTIVRKLPRKVDVLEGENAAFCVEVEEEEMEIHWYKDGTELRETHQTILKSFGKTHILVFVNTTPQDSGLVTFYVGRSKTSSQLRVKGARHCPPSCPVGVQINTERANAALLSWIPAPDSRKNPPSGYVLERQEVGSQEWLQCLTTDSATSVEILGDSVPCEADYRFRICSVNKYGRSDNVEFPRSVHLVPVARIQTPLQDALVPEGQDALFSIELSASVIGTWFLNGNQLQEEDRFSMRRTRTHQSLRIRGVRDTDNGAEITFIAYGIRDSAALYIQAPLVKFTPLSEMDRNKFVEVGNPIVLYCELSNPEAPVHWYKNGVELHTVEGLHIQSEGTMRRIVIQSADFSHSGVYSCDAIDDVIRFNVEVEAPPVRFSVLPETEKSKSIEAGCPFELQCELSDSAAQVFWYKDGTKILQQSDMDFQSNGTQRTLVVQSAEFCHSGIYSCKTKGDAVHFKVDVKAKPVRFSAVPEDEKNKYLKEGQSFQLQCEVTDPSAEVCWYKDGEVLIPEAGLDFQPDCALRRLIVHSAQPCHSGVYVCKTMDDSVQFTVEIKAQPMRFSALQEITKDIIEGNCQTDVPCEISDPTAMVCWYKDEAELISKSERHVNAEATRRTLSVPSTQPYSSGVHDYMNEADVVQLNIQEQALPMEYEAVSEVEKIEGIEPGIPTAELCEVSGPAAQVCSHKTGTELVTQGGTQVPSEGGVRKVNVQSTGLSQHGIRTSSRTNDAVPNKTSKAAEPFHSDVYSEISGDSVQSTVDKKAPAAGPVSVRAVQEIAENQSVEERCTSKIQCGISEPIAQLNEHRDGAPQQQTLIETQRVQSEDLCLLRGFEKDNDVGDEAITIKVDVKAPSMDPTAPCEVENNKSIEAYSSKVQHHKTIDSSAEVSIYQEGELLLHPRGIYSQSDGPMEKLVVKPSSASPADVCRCETEEHSVQWHEDQKAPPVTFLHIPEEDLHKNVVEHDTLLLSCELSRADVLAQWYKDGVELQPNENTAIQMENTVHTVKIKSSQLSDSGIYTCRAGDSALMFKVNVREPPAMIVYPKEDVHLDRYVPEEIVLSCELSRPNGSVNWYKDGQKLQESENIKLKLEGPYRRLKILKSATEDSGEYVCDTAVDSRFFHLNVTEPPVRIMSPSQSQMELCQQTSERMVLSCELSRANAVVRWYRDGLEVEENDRLLLEVDGIYRRLIIPETDVKDSAEYVCDTMDESVTFFVNIAEPPVRFIRPRKMASGVEASVGETVVLDCEVSRANAEVCWRKNGEEIEESANITITEDGLVRQLTIHSSSLEDTGQYICDARDDVMDFQVKISEPPLKILRTSDTVTNKHFVVPEDIVLKCELSRPNGTVEWYKNDEWLVENERISCESDGQFRSLIILNAEAPDAGEYVCDAKDDTIKFCVIVEEPPVTILGNAEKPEHHSLVAGDDLILECEVSRSNAPVAWYRNGQLLRANSRTHIESQGTVRKLVLSGLELSDSGEYVCNATEDKMLILVTVQEAPVKFNDKEEGSKAVAYEDESVTLCAKVNRENACVRWLKDKEEIIGNRYRKRSEGKSHYLTIEALKESDSGKYTCDAKNDEMHFLVLVKAMKVKFSKPLKNAVALKDSDLLLLCELQKPKGDVQWLKDDKEVTPSRHYIIRANGCERSLTIHNVTAEDAGVYACESKDERTYATVEVQTPRVVEFVAELHNVTVMEGEDATFKCVVSPEDAKLDWCINGKLVAPDQKFNISSTGLCHMLHIHNCQVTDSAKVTAEAEGLISKANLHVQEAQVVFIKGMETVEAEEFGEATLEVKLSSDSGEVQWMRQGMVIKPGPKFTLKQRGATRSLTIHRLALSDRGTYSCETLHDRTQAKLCVEPRKIKIRKGLSDGQTFERETASFEVELSHNNVEAAWLKDGVRLRNNNHWRLSVKGRVHSLTISNLSLEDSGTYVFSAESARTSARLTVKETPVSIMKKLEDVRFPEGSGATVECELSRHNVEVKWMKNGVELKPDKNHRIYSMGRKRLLQILKCEMEDTGIYTCSAGETSTACSVDVYEPEVEVLQPLEDLEVQEDENAVFMCELSLESVPGEWFKNGERIKPTSTIKIRQEGSKHFLLMCNVKGEDGGEIKFVAKNTESIAYLEVEELPVSIVNPLQDKTALEKSRVLLDCSVSNPRCSIRWYKGSNVILPSERFEICSEGCYRKLVIQQVNLEDEGTYSVQVGDYTSSAKLTVEAQSLLMVRDLQDVEVVSPEEACFECEVTVPVLKAPVWTLNGETLQPGSRVLLEKMGKVHRLTLRQTSEDMNGVVQFTSGKAKSSAKLCVKSSL
ncbi:obscurin-like protein 1 isoform X9 [Denticeps clupeoides]|uniref:obscurin-like protein 1 isoform X9 n=1 Tax=Denticeps clupeoides TaxID=299321 RepID=UPI0010A519F2|nr:obscurin-like protein 1 isoform X9 [Denticeps clupeoides]